MDFFDLLGINQLLEWGKEAIGIKKSQYTPIEITPAKYIYRPKNLLEYIGQERAKDLVNLNLQKIRTIKPIHFLISGNKGCGKSTLAGIIG
jgi:Holliday junction resolvasome RuvABC ATP-dependent DNA helicase subunit